MLRLDRLRAALVDELMLSDLGDAFSIADFANEALEVWAQHDWTYLEANKAELLFRPDDDSVELPEGTVSVIEVYESASALRRVSVVDRQTYWRHQQIPSTSWAVAVDELPSRTPERNLEPTPWLLLPTLNRIDSPITVIYNRAPLRVSAERDTIDVPFRLEHAFIALCRAMARGRYDLDSGGLEEQVERFMQSRVWQGAIDKDGVQHAVDMPREGAVGRELRHSRMSHGNQYDPDYYPR